MKFLKEYKEIYFFGIGGIGVSAIASMALLNGKKVYGSDISLSGITDMLEKMGAKIKEGQGFDMIPKSIDLIIYTSAIEVADPLLVQEIKKSGIKNLRYSEVLGEISKEKKTIAVSGTAGKTTVTAMLAEMFMNAKVSPTVIIGSLLKKTKSNFVAGDGDYLLVEADEYKRQFLNLNPYLLVINNIDEDHLDYYKDLNDIQNAFRELAEKVPVEGAIICDSNDIKIKPVIEGLKCKIIDRNNISLFGVNLKLPGEHNRLNAKTAIAVGDFVGIDRRDIQSSLSDFDGAWRRFEYKGQMKCGAKIYDDYAHNPQKVYALLSGTREMYKDSRIIAVFQPHLYSRTKTLLHEFAKSFNDADIVILLPIYPSREAFDPTISSEHLAESIIKNSGKDGKVVFNLKSFEDTEESVKKIADKNSVVLLIGAGNINEISSKLINQ